jgi:hypothetical protein
MSFLIEERLRDAYQAKTAQLTEQRLNQLAAAREHGLDELLGGERTAELPVLDFEASQTRRRQHRWIAPALAAAAVAAVAIGVIVFATEQPSSRPKPNPPASPVSRPPSSSSAPTPSPSASPSQTLSQIAPPYLPAGQTGSRDQVPWAAVGTGWRLLQPQNGYRPGRDLYLYDPAAGRYLITDALPAGASLRAWSPDGQRAMLTVGDSSYRQIDLHTGKLVSQLSVPNTAFVAYTKPRGLAVLLTTLNGTRAAGPDAQLRRYSTDGTLEQSYPPSVGSGPVYYTADGSEFVVDTSSYPQLYTNDGQLIRQLPAPAGYRTCSALKWWTQTSLLESCAAAAGSPYGLFIQSVDGSQPDLLTSSGGSSGLGFMYAWQLSNGDVLLSNVSGCGLAGYSILNPQDGSTRPLRLPAGVSAPGEIVNMAGNLATFLQQGDRHGCAGPTGTPQYQLIDYNLVTGQTHTLLDGLAVIVNWPGDGR